MLHWSKDLPWHACPQAVKWCGTQPSLEEAWANCDRCDWMLWLLRCADTLPDDKTKRRIVAFAAECAELVLPIFENNRPNDPRIRDCIEGCKEYAAGGPSSTLRAPRRAACEAIPDRNTRSFGASGMAARSAHAAAYAATCDSSDAFLHAAHAVVFATSACELGNQCCDILRKHFPVPPTLPLPLTLSKESP